MIDDSCRSKLQPANSAGGDRNKQGTRKDGSRETVEKDSAPPTPQRSYTSGRTSAVTAAARKHTASRCLVLGEPIAAHVPAWALQQHSDPKPLEEIASPVAAQPGSSSAPFVPLMTISETAALLHVAPRTIRRMIERGEANLPM
jgi:hypothetical protein